jgi:TonB family protein
VIQITRCGLPGMLPMRLFWHSRAMRSLNRAIVITPSQPQDGCVLRGPQDRGYFSRATQGRSERHAMLDVNAKATAPRPQAGLARPQVGGHATSPAGRSGKERNRLVIALALLVVALAVVLVKDHDFWFGSDEAVNSEAANSENAPKVQPTPAPAKAAQAVAPTVAPRSHPAPKTSVAVAVPAPTNKEAAKSGAPAVVTKRAVLPPLDIEVVAGDTHRMVHPGSNVAKVEIPTDSNRALAAATAAASQPTSAAERERLASVDLTYPLLAQHMKVQGSVVLQAVVGADGNIEGLKVLSGPSILTAAAQQAVRQWHFKPYLQNGQPVETKATIVVNFSIRVADNSAKSS